MKLASSIILFGTALLIIGNTLSLHSAIFGSILFVLFLPLSGWIFGTYFFPVSHPLIRLILGIIIPLTLIMIIGAGFYYAFHLGTVSVVTTLLIISTVAIIIQWLPAPMVLVSTEPRPLRWYLEPLPAVAFLAAAAFAVRILLRIQAWESIRSPWEILPGYFFIFIFVAAAALVVAGFLRARMTVLLTMVFAAIFFSITLFVYPLGYGFDPFIHQATEEYIADHGTINPKPFTYVGQYAFIDTVHRITNIPIVSLDRFLLPTLMVLFLPTAGWLAFSDSLAVVLLPLLPMTAFAGTTPQGVANAFVIISLLIAIGTRTTGIRGILILWLFGIATALIHPIAGLPLLVFVFLWNLLVIKNKFVKTVRPLFMGLAIILGSVALPLLFGIYGLLSGGGNTFHSDFLSRIIPTISEIFRTGIFETRFNPIIDAVYFFGANIHFIIPIGALLALIAFWRRGERWALVFVATAFVTFANGILLLAAIDFSFLPIYEQSGYAERLLNLSTLFLLPVFLWGLSNAVRIVLKKNNLFVGTAILTLLAGALTASLYLSYPHQDAYTTEHGWSVGKTDIEAVRFINQHAGSKPFIVLANQSVSAAALHEFGFKYYFPFTAVDGVHSTVFYYPIPTGGPLYDYFLRMSYDAPRRSTIEDALNRANVSSGYLVVNRYWFKSNELVEQAKSVADGWWEFGNGSVTVFEFKK